VAYERVTGPIGPERADRHAAIVAATVANAMRGKKGRTYKPEDFIPRWDAGAPPEQRQEQAEDDQLRLVQRLNKRFGGRLVQRQGGDPGGDVGGSGGRRRGR
jgi:hypothetical protein